MRSTLVRDRCSYYSTEEVLMSDGYLIMDKIGSELDL
jgi:hypothetical protein